MDNTIKYLEECNLIQACEWIAFGYKPRLAIYETDDMCPRPNQYEPSDLKIQKYLKSMEEAKQKLKRELFKKNISARGVISNSSIIFETSRPYYHAIKDEHIDNIIKLYLPDTISPTDEFVEIEDLPYNFKFDFFGNKLEGLNGIYSHIKIKFSDLQETFHRSATDVIKKADKESGMATFGRKTILTNTETVELTLYAQKIAPDYKSQKAFMHKCIDWVKDTFNKDISFTTIQDVLRPVLDEWKSQKNGK